jgi:hypothetical protein
MGRPTKMPIAWLPLVVSAGSVSELSTLLGYRATSSLRRLARGEIVPGLATLTLLAVFCERHALKNPLTGA